MRYFSFNINYEREYDDNYTMILSRQM